MHYRSPLLFFLATATVYTTALPIPSLYRVSLLAVQHAFLPAAQPPPLRIIDEDNLNEVLDPLGWEIEQGDEDDDIPLDSDSIFSQAPEGTASARATKPTPLAVKTKSSKPTPAPRTKNPKAHPKPTPQLLGLASNLVHPKPVPASAMASQWVTVPEEPLTSATSALPEPEADVPESLSYSSTGELLLSRTGFAHLLSPSSTPSHCPPKLTHIALAASVSPTLFSTSSLTLCGRLLYVTRGDVEVAVEVTGQCAACADWDLELSEPAYDLLAEPTLFDSGSEGADPKLPSEVAVEWRFL